MDNNYILGISAILLAAGCGGVGLYFYLFRGDQLDIRSLMGSPEVESMGTPSEIRKKLQNDPTGEEYDKFKKLSKQKQQKKKKELTIEERMFRAGLFTAKEKRDFGRLRMLLPFLTTPVGAAMGIWGIELGLAGMVIMFLWGLQLPVSILDRKIKRRDDDILYYLPLVIEQISIGVSSSLDVGPCIQRVVAMADERDTHNVVTELFRHVQYYVRSGVSLEDALNEVGLLSGNNELKHSFLSLSHVAKHGGEISRQLQELADAVSNQRESKIDDLASLVRSGLATMMVAGETGTGKTTLIKCIATQFGPEESIVGVEDTPELNFQHPYYRSLVSRPPNVEGVGEVTLQEHIKTTLRMTPTRVILGEMRTPYAAEAFLESAQTGHVGMSTIHARNARETLVRLESLLGRAQKSVSIDIIRQQIALAVDVVVWLHREKGGGKPRIGEIIEVGHFVEGVIQVRPMFSQIRTGSQPLWRVESWTSAFEDVLAKDGIFLGDSAREIGFSNVGGPDPGRK